MTQQPLLNSDTNIDPRDVNTAHLNPGIPEVHERFSVHPSDDFIIEDNVFGLGDMNFISERDGGLRIPHFSCPSCPYTSTRKGSLESHMRTHTGEKPFICLRCDYRTADRSNMRRHLAMRHNLDKDTIKGEIDRQMLPS